MADTIEDVQIYDGEAWQSIVQLAADNVDAVANLPIKSVDGTVVVDGASSVFTVSTGGKEQIKVDANGRFLVGPKAGDNPNFNNHFRTVGNQQLVIESDNGQPELKLKADDFWYYFSLSPDDDNFRLVSYDGATNATYNVFTARSSGEFNVINGIQTPSITGVAANDAEITLGSDLVVSTGGTDRVWVNNRGSFGVGANPASSVNFQNTGSCITGMRSDITHNSSSRASYSDGQLMVTNAAATADIGTMSGFRIVGRSSAGATVDQYYGCYVSEVPTGAGVAAGFRTTINGDGSDEGKASVSGFFNIYSDGDAPNYFGGEVRITPTNNLNCSKIVGASAPDSDACLELGSFANLISGSGNRINLKVGDEDRLLVTDSDIAASPDYQPTNLTSLATKAYTDLKAELWVGTHDEYLALGIYKNTTLYCVTD